MIPLRDYRPSGIVPYVTLALIVLNAVAFVYTLTYSDRTLVPLDRCVWEQTFRQPAPGFDPLLYRRYGQGCLYLVTERDRFVIQYGLIPAEFWSGKDLPPLTPFPIWVTLFTAMFLHGGWLHLLSNMWYLWLFGDNVEAALGRGRFLVFYLLSGVGAALLQMAVYPRTTAPMIGASGAIAGVMGAYLVLYPWARVLTLVPVFFFVQLVEVPAFLLLGLWFVLQFLSGLVDRSAMGGVAWFAHLGGFITGALLVLVLKRREVVPGLVAWLRRRRSPWGR